MSEICPVHSSMENKVNRQKVSKIKFKSIQPIFLEFVDFKLKLGSNMVGTVHCSYFFLLNDRYIIANIFISNKPYYDDVGKL